MNVYLLVLVDITTNQIINQTSVAARSEVEAGVRILSLSEAKKVSEGKYTILLTHIGSYEPNKKAK